MLDLKFTTAALVDGWKAIDDRVMGGVSSSQLAFHEDGYAVFPGLISSDNGGGSASVRHPELGLRDEETVGYRLQVRGDGKRYKFNLRMEAALDGTPKSALSNGAGWTSRTGASYGLTTKRAACPST